MDDAESGYGFRSSPLKRSGGDDAAQTMKGNGETAHGFIQKVKRATRRRFTSEEKIRILLEGMKREVTTSELCRKEGIHPHAYYSWLKDFMEAGKAMFHAAPS